MPNTTPLLSPARQALAAHFAECNKLQERIRVLSQPVRAYENAVIEEQQCAEALEAVAELEMAAWDRWVRSPHGSVPSPLVEERAAAASHLADAAEYRERLRLGARAAEKEITEVNNLLADLIRHRPALIKSILFEEAAALGARYVELARQAHAIQGCLEGLLDLFRKDNDGEGAAQITQILKAGRPSSRLADYAGNVASIIAEHEELKRLGASGKRLAQELVSALRGDPTATLEFGDAA